MNHFRLLCILVLLVSCNQSSSLRTQLEGNWSYEPSTAFGDTVSWSTEDFFTEPNRTIVIRKLDSGYYRFISQDSILTTVEPYPGVSVIQFRFNTDSTGHTYYYSLDSTNQPLNKLQIPPDAIPFKINNISTYGATLTETFDDSANFKTELRIEGSNLKFISADGTELITNRLKNPNKR